MVDSSLARGGSYGPGYIWDRGSRYRSSASGRCGGNIAIPVLSIVNSVNSTYGNIRCVVGGKRPWRNLHRDLVVPGGPSANSENAPRMGGDCAF
jgi:hypothetical protein